MKPDKIHVVRNEAVPKLPNKPAFDELATRAALHLATPWWSHWLTYTGAGVAVVAGVVGVTQYNTSAKETGPAKTPVVLTTSENTLNWKHPYDTLLVDV